MKNRLEVGLKTRYLVLARGVPANSSGRLRLTRPAEVSRPIVEKLRLVWSVGAGISGILSHGRLSIDNLYQNPAL